MNISREEVRRLEKAAKDKNKQKLLDWANQFKEQLELELKDKYYKRLAKSMDIVFLAVAYSLVFSENTKINSKDEVGEFMDDLLTTISLFENGEYNPNDYKEGLEKAGIFFD